MEPCTRPLRRSRAGPGSAPMAVSPPECASSVAASGECRRLGPAATWGGSASIRYNQCARAKVAAALGQSPAAQGALPALASLQGSQCRGWNGGLFPADRLGTPAHGVDMHAGCSVTVPRSRVLRPLAAPNCRRAPRFSGQKPAIRPRNGLQNTRATPIAGQNLLESARKRPRKLAGHTEN